MKRITLQTGNSVTIDEAMGLFITSCKVKNLSPATIKSYMGHLKLFQIYFDSSKPIKNISSTDIDSFILFLLNRNVKSTSVNSYLRTIRAFLYWSMERKLLDSFKIQKIKEDTIPKETYTSEELQALLKKPNLNKCTFVEYKTYVITCFLAATGQRLGATISLKKSDINLTYDTITFKRTKNRNSHIITIPQSLKPILVEYLSFLPDNVEWLFPNTYGRKAELKTIQENLIAYNRARGVNKTSAHLYRHTFAKTWIQNGYNQLELMRILDHTTIDMTNKYVNLYGKEVDINKCDILSQYQNNKIRIKRK